MEGNKDEALRALGIAQKRLQESNYAAARKLAQKSLALFRTPEGQKLLDIVEREATRAQGGASDAGSTSTGAGTKSTFSSGAETHPSASGAKHRHGGGESSKSTSGPSASASSGEKRDYTPENMAVVKRVRACKVTEYYEILELKRECTEADVKKAYRRVRHPCPRGCIGGLIARYS